MVTDNILPSICLLLYTAIVFIFYLKSKSQFSKIVTSILMATALAVLAYNFVPKYTYDLTRHYEMAARFTEVETVDSFLDVAGGWDLELLPQAFGWCVSQIGDYKILQTIPVLIGYSMLFYMLIDYRSIKNISTKRFLAIIPFIIFGQHILFYFSGLFCYFAICIFSFAFYEDYIKKKKRLAYFLYAIAPLMHISMLLPFVLMVLYKLKKGKFTNKTFILLFLAVLLFDSIITMIVQMFKTDYLLNLRVVLNGYMHPTDHLIGLYNGFYLFMSVVKLSIVSFILLHQRKKKDENNSRNAVAMMTIATVALSLLSIAMTRYSSLVLFMAIPAISDVINERSKIGIALTFLIVGLSIIFTIYSIGVIMPFIVF